MSLDLSDAESTLVPVMAWCRQAASHYWSQCWPRPVLLCGITRPQWVKLQIQHPFNHPSLYHVIKGDNIAMFVIPHSHMQWIWWYIPLNVNYPQCLNIFLCDTLNLSWKLFNKQILLSYRYCHYKNLHSICILFLRFHSFLWALYLTHWGLVTLYGDEDLGQHWFR